MNSIKRIFSNHLEKTVSATKELNLKLNEIIKIGDFLKKKINRKKKIFVYGNGGSYADGSHFVAELVSTYKKKSRKALPFIMLGSNLPSLTAWSNDNDYKTFLIREIDALSSEGDVLILISTSGGNIRTNQSINLLNLAKFSKKKKLSLISFLGKKEGAIGKFSDIKFHTNSNNTPIIQENQQIILHLISEYLDKNFK